jgi:hypothetical protein
MRIAVEVGEMSEEAVSSEMQLMRLNRIFKIMRLMRVVVVMKFVRIMYAKYKGKDVSKTLAVQLENIHTLKAFVEAHIACQKKLLVFLGSSETGAAKFDECEEARVILESWTQIYWAVVHGAAEMEKVEMEAPWIMGGMAVMRESTGVMEELTEFVVSAAKAGILKEKEAEAIIHPMQGEMKQAGRIFADCHSGIHVNRLKRVYENSVRIARSKSDDYGENETENETPETGTPTENPDRLVEDIAELEAARTSWSEGSVTLDVMNSDEADVTSPEDVEMLTV